MVLAVQLPEPGEPPRWGRDGGRTLIDAEIEAAPQWDEERQRRLFFQCARHLFDNQVREHVQERDDPSNNLAWLASLARWLGWDDTLRDDVIASAAKSAYAVLLGEERVAPDESDGDDDGSTHR